MHVMSSSCSKRRFVCIYQVASISAMLANSPAVRAGAVGEEVEEGDTEGEDTVSLASVNVATVDSFQVIYRGIVSCLNSHLKSFCRLFPSRFCDVS